MTITGYEQHLNEPVTKHARSDFAAFPQNLSVAEALEVIRQKGIGERIIYFYVVDEAGRLAGVLPTRRMLTAAPHQKLMEIMLSRVIALPSTATILEACELFVLHRLFAFPIIDEDRRLVGVVDIYLFTDEVFDMTESKPADSIFETIGFHVEQIRDASPARAFRFRFPWLVGTICTGTLCALLTSAFEITLAKSLVLAFFLTLVLGVVESVSMQSMAVTLQALRSVQPGFRWLLRAARRELATALLLALACGVVVSLIVWGWRGEPRAAATIGISIALAISAACLYGFTIPALLRAFQLDPKISAGPITLALTDLSTLAIYFTTARILIG
jgi:magnesium transporter